MAADLSRALPRDHGQLGRDVLSSVLAFLPSEEIALSARVARDWRTAAATRTAWAHSHMCIKSMSHLVQMSTTVHRQVRSMEIADNRLPTAEDVQLAGFSALTHLEVRFARDGTRLFGLLGDDDSDGASAATLLEALTIHNWQNLTRDQDAFVFLSHPRLHALRSLEIGTCNLDLANAIAHIHNLQRFTLAYLPVLRQDDLWKALSTFRDLHTIEMPSSNSPSSLTSLPLSLTRLVVRPTIDLASLLQPLLGQLRYLELTRTIDSGVDSQAEWIAAHLPLFDLISPGRARQLEHFGLRNLRDAIVYGRLPVEIATLIGQSHLKPTAVSMEGSMLLQGLALGRVTQESENKTSTPCAFFPFLTFEHVTALSIHKAEFVSSFRSLVMPHLRSLIFLVRPPRGATCDSSAAAMNRAWRELDLGRLVTLEILHLRFHTSFSDAGLGAVFRPLTRLTEVHLSDGLEAAIGEHRGFSDETARALAMLPRLERLELEGCRDISQPAVLQRLCDTTKSDRLRVLTIHTTGGNTGISHEKYLFDLARSHPTLRLTFDGKRVIPPSFNNTTPTTAFTLPL